MLTLAFEITTQQLTLISFGLTLAASFVGHYLQARYGIRQARIAKAGFAGLKKAAVDLAEHKDALTVIEDSIYEAAKDYGVPEEHIDAHLGEGLVPASKPQG